MIRDILERVDLVSKIAGDRAPAERLLEVRELVRAYLAAELEARSPPCLHRYRGAVRAREVARRQRAWREARDRLEDALALR